MKIYCIENIINEKKYVGLTIQTINERYRQHINSSINGSSHTIHNAIRKHGQNNFIIYELDSCDDVEQLKEREKFWIKILETKSKGYNNTDGGDGSPGRVLSEESKKKMSEAAILRFSDPKQRKKTSNTTKEGMKRWWNDMTKEEQDNWIERCKKRPEGYKPPPMSENHKRAISKANKGNKYALGIKRSEETKAKLSKNRKGKGTGKNNAMANPENRKKVSDSKRGKKRFYLPDGSYKMVYPEQMMVG